MNNFGLARELLDPNVDGTECVASHQPISRPLATTAVRRSVLLFKAELIDLLEVIDFRSLTQFLSF